MKIEGEIEEREKRREGRKKEGAKVASCLHQ